MTNSYAKYSPSVCLMLALLSGESLQQRWERHTGRIQFSPVKASGWGWEICFYNTNYDDDKVVGYNYDDDNNENHDDYVRRHIGWIQFSPVKGGVGLGGELFWYNLIFSVPKLPNSFIASLIWFILKSWKGCICPPESEYFSLQINFFYPSLSLPNGSWSHHLSEYSNIILSLTTLTLLIVLTYHCSATISLRRTKTKVINISLLVLRNIWGFWD